MPHIVPVAKLVTTYFQTIYVTPHVPQCLFIITHTTLNACYANLNALHVWTLQFNACLAVLHIFTKTKTLNNVLPHVSVDILLKITCV